MQVRYIIGFMQDCQLDKIDYSQIITARQNNSASKLGLKLACNNNNKYKNLKKAQRKHRSLNIENIGMQVLSYQIVNNICKMSKLPTKLICCFDGLWHNLR